MISRRMEFAVGTALSHLFISDRPVTQPQPGADLFDLDLKIINDFGTDGFFEMDTAVISQELSKKHGPEV